MRLLRLKSKDVFGEKLAINEEDNESQRGAEEQDRHGGITENFGMAQQPSHSHTSAFEPDMDSRLELNINDWVAPLRIARHENISGNEDVMMDQYSSKSVEIQPIPLRLVPRINIDSDWERILASEFSGHSEEQNTGSNFSGHQYENNRIENHKDMKDNTTHHWGVISGPQSSKSTTSESDWESIAASDASGNQPDGSTTKGLDDTDGDLVRHSANSYLQMLSSASFLDHEVDDDNLVYHSAETPRPLPSLPSVRSGSDRESFFSSNASQAQRGDSSKDNDIVKGLTTALASSQAEVAALEERLATSESERDRLVKNEKLLLILANSVAVPVLKSNHENLKRIRRGGEYDSPEHMHGVFQVEVVEKGEAAIKGGNIAAHFAAHILSEQDMVQNNGHILDSSDFWYTFGIHIDDYRPLFGISKKLDDMFNMHAVLVRCGSFTPMSVHKECDDRFMEHFSKCMKMFLDIEAPSLKEKGKIFDTDVDENRNKLFIDMAHWVEGYEMRQKAASGSAKIRWI